MYNKICAIQMRWAGSPSDHGADLPRLRVLVMINEEVVVEVQLLLDFLARRNHCSYCKHFLQRRELSCLPSTDPAGG